MRKKVTIIVGIILFITIIVILCINKNKSNMEIETKNKAENDLRTYISADTEEIGLFTKKGGIMEGQHAQSDIDDYKNSIEKAQELLDKTNNTQIELEKAIADLVKADNVFTDSPKPTENATSLIVSDSQSKTTEPTIGMTAEEVNNSSWGKPEKINRTTNAYGTSEQWVYSGYRYVYLDNGIVTTIQD